MNKYTYDVFPLIQEKIYAVFDISVDTPTQTPTQIFQT